MSVIASTPQSDALQQSLPAQRELPQAASSALRRVRELEREVVLLRGALADLSDEELQDTAWKDKLAQLLGKVLLFRIALGGEPESGNKEYSSRRDR